MALTTRNDRNAAPESQIDGAPNPYQTTEMNVLTADIRSDLEQFRTSAWEFVDRCAHDATYDQRKSAVDKIVRNFKFLFDRKGQRKSPTKGYKAT